MLPLGAASAAASVGATAERVLNREDARASSVAAAGAVGVVGITVTVNEPANRKFASEDLSDDETATLLARWQRWHDVRIVLGLDSGRSSGTRPERPIARSAGLLRVARSSSQVAAAPCMERWLLCQVKSARSGLSSGPRRVGLTRLRC
jgi:hypothetical protein